MPKVDFRGKYERQTDAYMEAINAAIGAKQLKQRRIAEALQVNPSTVSRHLSDIDNMKLGDLRRLTSILGLSVKIEKGE